MSGFDGLGDAFCRLNKALRDRLSPAFNPGVHDAWLGTLAQAAAIAKAKDQWDAMPDEDEHYASVVGDLDDASFKVTQADGGSDASLLAAASAAQVALSTLSTLLGM